MIELAVADLVKYYGAQKVLDGLSMEVQQGERVGVVGANGSGKTTLLCILAGLESKDAGMIALRRGAAVGYLDQTPSFPGRTVDDVLQEPFAALKEKAQAMAVLEAELSRADEPGLERRLQRYAALQAEYEMAGGYAQQEKLQRVLTGLKIPAAFLSRPFHSLSGGEQSRVLLGRTLLQEADILLLDEPTNHLDLDSLAWLEEYLSQYRGTAIMISHDRYFLDRAATATLEIEQGRARRWHGGYSYFVAAKAEVLKQQQAAYENQQKKVQSMEAAIANLRQWGKQGDNEKFFRRAASMEKRLEKMDKVHKPKLEADAPGLILRAGRRAGDDVLAIEDLGFSYGDTTLFQGVHLHLRWQERTAIVGQNGVGKTTLLELLKDPSRAQAGRIRWGASVQIGWLDQMVHFDQEDDTVLQSFRGRCPMAETQARNILAKFLFRGPDVFKQVRNLSGGERSRLRLAQLMHEKHNVLVMDEPTNHLDIPGIEALEQALSQYQGTLLFVSHDRYFINRMADRVVELEGGQLHTYWGNFDEYWRNREKRRCKKEQQSAEDRSPQRRSRSKPGRVKENSRAQSERLEGQILQLEKELEVVKERLHDAGDDPDLTLQLFRQQQQLEDDLAAKMEAWLQTQE